MNATFSRRRDFLAGVAVAASANSALGYQANVTVKIGCIGIGGRCRRLMTNLAAIPGTRITAICEVWNDSLEQAKQLAGPGVFATKDYRALLARKDVDSVLIGSPDRWQMPMTIDACGA